MVNSSGSTGTRYGLAITISGLQAVLVSVKSPPSPISLFMLLNFILVINITIT